MDKINKFRHVTRINDIAMIKEIFDELTEAYRQGGDCDPLTLAVQNSESDESDLVRSLLNLGASPNDRSLDGRTSLYWATSRGEREFVDVLVQGGANVDEENPNDGCTSLHLAAMRGFDDIITILLRTNHNEKINKTDDFLFTPIAYAAWNGHLESVKLLLDDGADVNAHDEARAGDTAIKVAAERNDVGMVKMFLDRGADPDIPGWMGLTATYVAQQLASAGSPEILSLFTNYKAK